MSSCSGRRPTHRPATRCGRDHRRRDRGHDPARRQRVDRAGLGAGGGGLAARDGGRHPIRFDHRGAGGVLLTHAVCRVRLGQGVAGVTTTVTALAATWPRDRDLVVTELDPAGGDLGVRIDLATEPGLVALAAAGRRQLDRQTFVGHTQPLPFAGRPATDGDTDGAIRRVLCGAGGGRSGRCRPCSAAGWAARGVVVARRRRVRRLWAPRPGLGCADVVTEADLLVLVGRPVVAEVRHLAPRLSGIRPKALSLLLIGDRPYSVAEVADAVGANPLGTLPVDDRAAAALTIGRSDGARILRRSRLLRDARAVAEGLAGWLPALPEKKNQPPRPRRRRPDPCPRARTHRGPSTFVHERDEERQ